jgi:hypothetical protein
MLPKLSSLAKKLRVGGTYQQNTAKLAMRTLSLPLFMPNAF